jgi:hypothetical protein
MKMNDMFSHKYDDEDLINNILDKGITEIRSNTTSQNTNNIYKQSQQSLTYSTSFNHFPTEERERETSLDNQQPKSSALKALLEDLKNEYKSKPNLKASNIGSLTESVNINFNDMKYEIKDLQNKLNGLEKKINSNSVSRDVSLSHSKPKGKVRYSQVKEINTYQSDDEVSKTRMNRFSKKDTLKSTIESNFKKSISKGRRTLSPDKSFNRSIKSLEGSKNYSKKVDWKEKYFKLKSSYEDKKKELVREKIQTAELLKKNKQMAKKENIYDNLLEQFKDIQSKCSRMQKKFEESEFIRKEQSRLIKSMQGEIELLRGTFEERSNTFYENEMKQVKSEKKKKKSTSKPKIKKYSSIKKN